MDIAADNGIGRAEHLSAHAVGKPYVRAFAPGRTELAGNHTDHQRGRVIAAAVTDGIHAVATENGTDIIHVASEGFTPFDVDLAELIPVVSEQGSPASLVRGMAAGFMLAGVPLHGIDVALTSTLPAGGGLSSSAAFELVTGCILNTMFADDALDMLALARMAQRVECEWFGKSCGLMDQTIIALGGMQEIDLACPDDPQTRAIDFNFTTSGYSVCLVDVGCDHSRFAKEYSRIPLDMCSAAHVCGAEVLGEVDEDMFMAHLEKIRTSLGDRALLRGMHFYREMRLTDLRADALRHGDIEAFLRYTESSGASSAQYLQNVFCDDNAQPAMVALALAQHLLDDRGACRIHGGGFGGSIQVFVPSESLLTFIRGMEKHLGAGCCRVLTLSEKGAEASWV